MSKISSRTKSFFFPLNSSELQTLKRIAAKLKNSTDLSSEEISQYDSTNLWCILLFHPDSIIRRKAAGIYQTLNHLRFRFQVYSHFKKTTQSPRLKLKIHFMHCIFLDSKKLEEYRFIRNRIRKNFSEYEPILLKSLIHSNQSIAINCAFLLNLHKPEKYLSNHYLDLIHLMPISLKQGVIQYFDYLLRTKKKFDWEERENIINICKEIKLQGCFHILQNFKDDTEEECKIALGAALQNHKNPESQNLLLKLLLDRSETVRGIAANSMRIILPGLKFTRTPSEILNHVSPLQLLTFLKGKPYFGFLKKIWEQKKFSPKILEQDQDFSNADLINIFIQTNLESEVSKTKARTYQLLLKSRMPHILDDLNSKLHAETNPQVKNFLTITLKQIQDEFRIIGPSGISLIL